MYKYLHRITDLILNEFIIVECTVGGDEKIGAIIEHGT